MLYLLTMHNMWLLLYCYWWILYYDNYWYYFIAKSKTRDRVEMHFKILEVIESSASLGWRGFAVPRHINQQTQEAAINSRRIIRKSVTSRREEEENHKDKRNHAGHKYGFQRRSMGPKVLSTKVIIKPRQMRCSHWTLSLNKIHHRGKVLEEES